MKLRATLDRVKDAGSIAYTVSKPDGADGLVEVGLIAWSSLSHAWVTTRRSDGARREFTGSMDAVSWLLGTPDAEPEP